MRWWVALRLTGAAHRQSRSWTGLFWQRTCQAGPCCSRGAGFAAIRGLFQGAILGLTRLNFLSVVKNPPVFAKQANINNGGQQQVNNGAQPAAALPGTLGGRGDRIPTGASGGHRDHAHAQKIFRD